MSVRLPVSVELVGKGSVTLTQNDHVGTGGEGSVFRKSGVAVKIYADSRKMTADGMADKIEVLAGFSHPYLVSPGGLALIAGRPVGFWMPFADGEPPLRHYTSRSRSPFPRPQRPSPLRVSV